MIHIIEVEVALHLHINVHLRVEAVIAGLINHHLRVAEAAVQLPGPVHQEVLELAEVLEEEDLPGEVDAVETDRK